MSALEMLGRLRADSKAGKTLEWRKLREEIHDEAERTTSTEDRVVLLSIFKAVMDQVEETLSLEGELATFKKARSQDYSLLLMREVLIGQNVSTELLYAVTQREIDAGRMTEDHMLRKSAVKDMAEPYQSVQELIAVEQKRMAAEKKSGWRRVLNWVSRRSG